MNLAISKIMRLRMIFHLEERSHFQNISHKNSHY